MAYEKSTSDLASSNHAPSPSGHAPYPNIPRAQSTTSSGGGSGGGSLFKFRQSETQLKGEVAFRAQFLSTLHQQQDLMDAITEVSLELVLNGC